MSEALGLPVPGGLSTAYLKEKWRTIRVSRTQIAFAVSLLVLLASPLVMAQGMITGNVVETMDSGGYTYVLVDAGDKKVWAAAPVFTVGVGDKVSFVPDMPMTNYHSKSLDRTFDVVYFTAFVSLNGKEPSAAAVSPHASPASPEKPPAAAMDFSGITKAAGGKTVGEVFDGKSGLAGQAVSVRGKVVKYTGGVMGKNWIHLQDGTKSASGANDLTVTTAGAAAVGDTGLVKRTVVLDQDFCYGYEYEVLVEDASVQKE